jgi:hypothetical protein
MRILPLLVVLVAAVGSARAESVWLDAKMGCGRGAAFAKSGKAEDLPGCTGRFPKDAPPLEVALHDAKRALVEAEELLGKNKPEKAGEQIEAARAALAKAPMVHPEIPDRADQALPLYQRVLESLDKRRQLTSLVDELRKLHQTAVEAGRTKNKFVVEGGPAEAKAAASACHGKFVSAAAAVKGDWSTTIEIEKGSARSLKELAGECEQIMRTADALAREQEKAAKAKRAAWRKQLKGDRRKIFDEHPDTLPEISGGTVGTAQVWKYKSATGEDIYTWKGNKLASRK